MSVNPRVLYVDDDVENCELMKYWIREECGCDISIAMDGKEAGAKEVRKGRGFREISAGSESRDE